MCSCFKSYQNAFSTYINILLALQLSLTAGQTFDYETRSSFTVSFTVTDTMATTGPIDLTVNINNINEACYFDKSYYYVSLAEATVRRNTFECIIIVKLNHN